STCFEVAGHLGWTRHKRTLAELDLFNQILAVNETLAHLEVLRERGWLTSTVDDGVEHFTRA
ncbi:MAG: MBL fold metallo-hydrolase, partial [Jatrophihabitantaceae bacterium]